MSFAQGTTRVMMVRPDLHNLPAATLPPDYAIRWYQPGDEAHWHRLKARADQYHTAGEGFFWETYGAHQELLPRRQAYLVAPDGAVVGTLTGWFEELGGRPYGKINWMLLDPAVQGLGLAKPLLAAVCRRLSDLGHEQLLLYTLTARVPAINLYRQFGFVPLIRGPHDVAAWAEANPALKRPYAPEERIDAGA